MFGLVETTVIVGLFLVAAGLWVLLAKWLASYPVLANRLDEYGDIIVPILLVAVGIVIVAGSYNPR